MKKKLLILIVAFAIVASSFAGINFTDVNAVSVTMSNMFTQESGSSYITRSVDENGAKMTFNSTAKETSIKYLQLMHMEHFEVVFELLQVEFKEFYVTLKEYNVSSKFLRVTLSNDGSNLKAVVSDNLRNEVETIIPSSKLEGELKIIYDGITKQLYFNNDMDSDNHIQLNMQGIVTDSFYNQEANMVFGVKGHSDENASNIYVKSIANKNGNQEINSKTSTNIDPIVAHYASNELNFSNGDTIELKAALGYKFTIPYYAIDVLGNKLYIKTQFEAKDANTFDNDWYAMEDNKSKYPSSTSMTYIQMSGNVEGKKLEVGDKYYIHISNVYEQNNVNAQWLTLKVTLVDDTEAPVIVADKLVTAVNEYFPNLSIDAPMTGNTLSFPSLNAFGDVIDFDKGDGIDAIYNVEFQVGYKRPGDAAWSWSSNTEVSINTIGYWTFTYRVKDAAGNMSYLGSKIGDITFGYYVNDIYSPEIDVSKEQVIYKNKAYTIPTPKVTDNASGVDSAWTKYKVYYIDGNGNSTLLEDNKDSMLYNGVLTAETITNDGETEYYFLIEYSARDKAGNVAETKTTKLIVKVSPNPVERPVNNIMKIIAIVLASVAGVLLVIMLVVNPEKRKEKAGFIKNKIVEDEKEKKEDKTETKSNKK